MSSSESRPDGSEFKCMWKCGICVSVCSEKAISHGSELFVINKAACSKCLWCVRTCPAGMIAEDLFA